MKSLDKNKALVLFSGGQDSSIALAWALDRYERVYTVGFDYGQRHTVELGARASVRSEILAAFPQWAQKLAADTLVDATALARIVNTALTRPSAIEQSPEGLPTTFVPGRNLLFLVLAGAICYDRGIGSLVAGMSSVDYSGYPDCRPETIAAQLEALKLGMEADFQIETPLMSISKGDSWRLAEKIGGRTLIDIVNKHSHTCYNGVRSTLHPWGYGCGECPACELRKQGWEDYAKDAVVS